MIARSLILTCLATAIGAAALCGCGQGQGELEVTVVDQTTGNPVAGAIVYAGTLPLTTNQGGTVETTLGQGGYGLEVMAPGYFPVSTQVEIYAGGLAQKTVPLSLSPVVEPSLRPTAQPSLPPGPLPSSQPQPAPSALPSFSPQKPTAAFDGVVTDLNGRDVRGAIVKVVDVYGHQLGTTTTDVYGHYVFANMPLRVRLFVSIQANGFQNAQQELTLSQNGRLDFPNLRPTSAPMPSPVMAYVWGQVQDTTGASADGAIVSVTSADATSHFSQSVTVHNGMYQLDVPSQIPLRFTAGGGAWGSVSFIDTVPAPSFGFQFPENFTGDHALPFIEGPGGLPPINN